VTADHETAADPRQPIVSRLLADHIRQSAAQCDGSAIRQEFRGDHDGPSRHEQVKVWSFDSAVEGFFLNHSAFLANFEDSTGYHPGPTGLEAGRTYWCA